MSEELFRTRGHIEGGVVVSDTKESLDLASLPPILRVLLVTDGTVTKSLESYFWEPVRVELEDQSVQSLSHPVEDLDCEAEDALLVRRVRLVGKKSAVVFVHAESLIKLQKLPDPIRQDLLAGSIGIGELLRDLGLETYRELRRMGNVSSSNTTDAMQIRQNGPMVYRTYRIVLSGDPSILITEKFPTTVYENAHHQS